MLAFIGAVGCRPKGWAKTQPYTKHTKVARVCISHLVHRVLTSPEILVCLRLTQLIKSQYLVRRGVSPIYVLSRHVMGWEGAGGRSKRRGRKQARSGGPRGAICAGLDSLDQIFPPLSLRHRNKSYFWWLFLVFFFSLPVSLLLQLYCWRIWRTSVTRDHDVSFSFPLNPACVWHSTGFGPYRLRSQAQHASTARGR